jgi:hypothetical protein
MNERQLRVFVGSAMTELRDVRSVLKKALEDRGIEPFIYEASAGAQPDTITETSLRELRESDIFLGLFWQKYPKVTLQEFEEARRVDKPCFVYIRDKGTERDVDLERFLRSEVYDLIKGVSYDYFTDPVKLAEQAADDVLAWLVRRHREMTAELQTARISDGDLARLREQVERLQAATRNPLPYGTAADRMAHDLRGWFSALGYGIERELERADEAFVWAVNVPVQRPGRRGYVRVLVRGIEGEAGLSDLKALEALVERERTDDGWLISVRRVGAAVRAAIENHRQGRLSAYTFDEFLDESADFSRYFDWLDAEVRRLEIDKVYVPLAAAKDDFESGTGAYLGRSVYDHKNGWLEGYVDRWLDDPSKEHVSILGEFGTGKTWFALHYAWIALKRYQEAKQRGTERPRLPLVVPLRDYAKAVTVESLFSEFFFRKHEIPLPGYSAFEQLNRMGKLLLIFDGFDEMAARVDRQAMVNNFWQLARVVVPGSKAILTCRTEHFPEVKEGRALLSAELKASTAKLTGAPPQFEVLDLQQLDDDQIRQVLRARAQPATVARISGNPQLLDLARRPVMIGYILEALPEIEAGKPVDLSRIYLYAVTRKMGRDIESGRTFTSLADKLYFLCELSWEMLSTDKMTLNYREFPERLANLFGDLVKEQKDLDHWHYDMMGQSLLVRNADGDYTPAHRSLLEFFVAYKFAAELGILARDFMQPAREQSNIAEAEEPRDYTWSSYFRRTATEGRVQDIAPLAKFSQEVLAALAQTFGLAPLGPAVAELMRSMIAESAGDQLLKVAASTANVVSEAGLVGGNALSLLIRLDRSALRGKGLPGARLDYADFSGADLTECDLRRVSLRNARISGVSLERVQLQQADISQAIFGDVRSVMCLGVSSDGRYYAAGHEDGSVRISAVGTGAEVTTIRAHKGAITCLTWMPDSIHILTGGAADGSWGMWKVPEGSAVFFKDHAYRHWVVDIAYDVERQRIITAGGIDDQPLKVWDPRGNFIGQWKLGTANQANRVSIASGCRYVLVSHVDRSVDSDAKWVTGVSLCRCLPDGELALFRNLAWPNWNVCFLNKDARFYAQNRQGYVAIYDADNPKRVRRLNAKGSPICISHSDEIIAVVAGGGHEKRTKERPDAELQLWHIGSNAHLMTLRFGPQQQYPSSVSSRSRDLDACFAQDDSVLIGGSDDSTLRFWDVRLFVTSDGLPQPAVECSATDRSLISEDCASWPQWWQRLGIDPPEGMLPNPDFGKELRVIEVKMNCNGLQLKGVKGLSSVTVPGVQEPTAAKMRQWFRERGARA